MKNKDKDRETPGWKTQTMTKRRQYIKQRQRQENTRMKNTDKDSQAPVWKKTREKTKRHQKEKNKGTSIHHARTLCCPGERGCGRQELHVQHQVHQHQHQRRQQQRTGNHHFNHDVRIHKTVPQIFELKVSLSLRLLKMWGSRLSQSEISCIRLFLRSLSLVIQYNLGWSASKIQSYKTIQNLSYDTI